MSGVVRLILAALVGAAFAGSAAALIFSHPAAASQPLVIATTAPKRVATPALVAAPPVARTAQPLQVYVSGAVATPGVYALPPSARVHDALTAAGGPTSDADLNRVNLAAPLSDGEQVNVPRVGDPITATTQTTKNTRPKATPTPTGVWTLNINTASSNDFQQLEGIGKVTADRLVAYRDQNGPYATVDDLLKAGLKASELSRIRDRLTVQ